MEVEYRRRGFMYEHHPLYVYFKPDILINPDLTMDIEIKRDRYEPSEGNKCMLENKYQGLCAGLYKGGLTRINCDFPSDNLVIEEDIFEPERVSKSGKIGDQTYIKEFTEKFPSEYQNYYDLVCRYKDWGFYVKKATKTTKTIRRVSHRKRSAAAPRSAVDEK